MKKIFITLVCLLVSNLYGNDFREVQNLVDAGSGVKLFFYQSADNKTIEFRAVNPGGNSFNLEISMDLDNMQSSAALPFKYLLRNNQPSEIKLFNIKQTDSSKAFYYRNFKWYLRPASSPASTGKPVVHKGVYSYPWPKGKSFRVDNGFNGYGAHTGIWAYGVDFKMKVGSPICAARSGVVVGVEQGFSKGGNDPALGNKANYIYIKHNDGSIARYLHIKRKGARVRLGQKVKIGQVIALSGNVGWSTDPHLHFDIVVPDGNGGLKTVPFKFANGRGIRLRKGRGKGKGRGKSIYPKTGMILSH